MKPLTKEQRERIVIRWVKQGKPLYDLRYVFGVTRERVRQMGKDLLRRGLMPTPVDWRPHKR